VKPTLRVTEKKTWLKRFLLFELGVGGTHPGPLKKRGLGFFFLSQNTGFSTTKNWANKPQKQFPPPEVSKRGVHTPHPPTPGVGGWLVGVGAGLVRKEPQKTGNKKNPPPQVFSNPTLGVSQNALNGGGPTPEGLQRWCVFHIASPQLQKHR